MFFGLLQYDDTSFLPSCRIVLLETCSDELVILPSIIFSKSVKLPMVNIIKFVNDGIVKNDFALYEDKFVRSRWVIYTRTITNVETRI